MEETEQIIELTESSFLEWQPRGKGDLGRRGETGFLTSTRNGQRRADDGNHNAVTIEESEREMERWRDLRQAEAPYL